ncbi:uncharacterized protein UBRO_20506 [Ustilago bromivora]|uniref:Uncharacterized protein n=1 Tax=Ustilago bromivora TaxID=307758 RepID=A0A1K0FYJ9_9BASI|nr:uncharacterized protein UBRO_20506 [Ustilago bromivora]
MKVRKCCGAKCESYRQREYKSDRDEVNVVANGMQNSNGDRRKGARTNTVSVMERKRETRSLSQKVGRTREPVALRKLDTRPHYGAEDRNQAPSSWETGDPTMASKCGEEVKRLSSSIGLVDVSVLPADVPSRDVNLGCQHGRDFQGPDIGSARSERMGAPADSTEGSAGRSSGTETAGNS